MRPCARPFLLPEVLSLLWSAALVQNERRMKTGLADRQTSIVCEHVWNKRQQHRGVFSLLGPAAHGSPPIQPDSLVFPSNFFLLSLCLASPSVPYIFFFFPPFYNILIQCFYTLSLCFLKCFSLSRRHSVFLFGANDIHKWSRPVTSHEQTVCLPQPRENPSSRVRMPSFGVEIQHWPQHKNGLMKYNFLCNI